MREIKYRVIDPEKNEWIYLEPFSDEINEYVFRIFQEYPNTIGQYIGLLDRNDVEIYEGDLVEIQHPAWHEKCIVEFKDGSFIFRALDGDVKGDVIPGYTFMRETWQVKVIGNIYKNL